MTEASKRIMGELVKLNKEAEVHAARAERLIDEDEKHRNADGFPIDGPPAVVAALLAIEARLAMAALFVIAAMEDEDETH